MLLWNLLEGEQPKNYTSLIIMGVLIVGVIGLFIWSSVSNKKKQKQAQEMLNGLKIGDKVKTIGGICGYVVQINDAENTFVLETGLEENKSYVKFDRGAVYQTAPATQTAPEVAVTAEKVEEAPVEAAPAKKTTTKKAPAKKAPAKKVEEEKAE